MSLFVYRQNIICAIGTHVGEPDRRKLGERLLFRSGEPVVGMGVPLPPVVVV